MIDLCLIATEDVKQKYEISHDMGSEKGTEKHLGLWQKYTHTQTHIYKERCVLEVAKDIRNKVCWSQTAAQLVVLMKEALRALDEVNQFSGGDESGQK